MRRILSKSFLAALMAAGSVAASAQSDLGNTSNFTVPLGIATWIDQSQDYAVGDVVGGWKVLEYRDAMAGNSNGAWTTYDSGGMGGDARNGSTVLWFYNGGDYAKTTFQTPSTAIAFMVESDYNDGLVNFYVDGSPVLSGFNMQALPGINGSVRVGTLIVSGLAMGPHEVMIQSAQTAYYDDFHMYGAAAVAAVPEPETYAMLLAGLGIMGGIARRRKQA